MNEEVLLNTDFKELQLFRKGKVRDVYDLGDKLLIVSTDRISCFDVVLPCGIPYKGEVLTALSCFWFDFLKNIIPNHYISADVDKYPPELKKYKNALSGRSMLVNKSKPFAAEFIVRGYLSGSGWKEYQKQQSICGIKLPAGLKESARLPEIIFTPSTKAEAGHDQNISREYLDKLIGKEAVNEIARLSVGIYKQASDYAYKRGIIIADTKFEFGLLGNKIILIDEVLTPDSSRFWPLDTYVAGQPQPSFDKQFVRDYLEALNWNKVPPAPMLPEGIILKTSQKYLEAYRKLTGEELKQK
ncbi:MAG: phosphoribosylaminoimidazolesuccinocarboxamide synthase [Candidatus Omnitrophica bacterium]|nr:phosphoribosylaminoimidazolesuccinocarboxamide synthase [Candidatus Omnitrophota bacterium]MDD5662388.1 phosphoribosylaminoimidazolesuccinocarboxamide synthase [Candidatus Omnitrophota bacterium]